MQPHSNRPLLATYAGYHTPLTLKAPNKNCNRRDFNFLLLSLEENKAWFFMWILCLAEDSLETSSLIFSEKQWKKIYECRLLQSWLALRVKIDMIFILHNTRRRITWHTLVISNYFISRVFSCNSLTYHIWAILIFAHWRLLPLPIP